MATCLAVGGAAPSVFGQNTPPPKPPAQNVKPSENPPPPKDSLTNDPELNDQSVEDALDDMRKRPAAARPVGPTTTTPAVTVPPAAGQGADPLAGMTGSDFGVPTARRLREGTFLSRREGTLLRISTGDWIFVPRPTAAGTPDRPMVLLPSQTLQRLEDAAALAGARPGAVISGQVFGYRGREYLLPTMPSSTSADNAGPQPAGGPEAPASTEPADPAVRDLIKDLESKRSATPGRVLTPSPTAKSGARSDPKPAVPAKRATSSRSQAGPPLTEGSLITSRRGRLSRLSGGELAFAPDTDADSTSDHPLVLLPCQTLSRMEDVTLWHGDSQVLEVSGRILTYQGRNYLLPTMYVVPPPSEVAPLQ